MDEVETAALLDAGGEFVASVQIPAFPRRPVLLAYQGPKTRYFIGGDLGYGKAKATYREVQAFAV